MYLGQNYNDQPAEVTYLRWFNQGIPPNLEWLMKVNPYQLGNSVWFFVNEVNLQTVKGISLLTCVNKPWNKDPKENQPI